MLRIAGDRLILLSLAGIARGSVCVALLRAMAEKRPVSLIPHEAELTTQQAAEFLNVSRPYLVGLIDKGDIKHRLVGTHRRILMSDLVAYKKKSEETRRQAIERLVAEAQKLQLP